MSTLTLSVREAAAELGISDDLVYELIARGELPAVALGRRKVIPRRAIDLVLERALEGFDPDALLTSLALEAGSSSAAGDGADASFPPGATVERGEGSTSTTGSSGSSAVPTPDTPQAAKVAPVVELRTG
jgi:excisionase family DNA binding protein